MKSTPTAVLGVIPARAESTRFPWKVLHPIAGKPMIQHVWEAAKRAGRLTDILVATDHPKVAAAVEAFGGKAVLTPVDCANGTERLAFLAQENPSPIWVGIQGDEPLLESANIDALVDALVEDPETQMATLAVLKPTSSPDYLDPNVVKVVTACDSRALYFSRKSLGNEVDAEFARHVGIYAFRRPALLQFPRWKPTPLEISERLEQLRFLEHGVTIKVRFVSSEGIAVDTPADVEKVERLLQRNVLS